MTEEEARQWLRDHNVSRGTLERLGHFVTLLQTRSSEQNLVAASTLATIWARHIVDSAQLIDLAPLNGEWVDLGSGAGFPGLIIAAIGNRPVTLVEPRSKRVAFLHEAAVVLEIQHLVQIVGTRVELVPRRTAGVITARAFAPLPRLFDLALHIADADTRWILPKGRRAVEELDTARGTCHYDAQVVPSITDPAAAIIVATDVRRREPR